MIVSPAIRYKGKIFLGGRSHIDIMMANELMDMDNEQGFLTDDNKFVNRTEAYKIAEECNQLKSKSLSGQLFSYNFKD